jgi:hypothetical protein
LGKRQVIQEWWKGREMGLEEQGLPIIARDGEKEVVGQ